MNAQTKNHRKIRASKEAIYKAFTDPNALAEWLAPGEMVGKIRNFESKVGGGYEMSLFYPDREDKTKGKTSGNEDRYTAKFIKLTPFEKIVQGITFDTSDPDLSGEMLMDVTLEPNGEWTNVVIEFRNIPKGINPKDNELGTELSLDKLVKFLKENNLDQK